MHVCICYGYTLLHVYICKLHALSMEGWGGVWGEMGRDCLLNQGRGLQDIVLGPRICPCGLNNWSIFIGYPVYMNVHCSCRNDGKDLIVYWSKAGGFICCPMLLLFLTCVRSPISNVDAQPNYTILHILSALMSNMLTRTHQHIHTYSFVLGRFQLL